MTVTFCGHSDMQINNTIQNKLTDTIEKLIYTGASNFFLGGYGNFDILAAQTVFQYKNKFPEIKSFLIIPYLNKNYNMYLYDETIYPPIERVPLKYAILKRNEWMVENADIVVAYVNQNWGGAAKTLSYAKRKNKQTINIFDNK